MVENNQPKAGEDKAITQNFGAEISWETSTCRSKKNIRE
jgi:hypothetical protein